MDKYAKQCDVCGAIWQSGKNSCPKCFTIDTTVIKLTVRNGCTVLPRGDTGGQFANRAGRRFRKGRT